MRQPRVPRTDAVDGDAGLAAEARAVLGRRHDVVAVATVTPYGTRTAALGTTLDSDFEIGSISKGVTGMLYHVALERGEVTPSTTLGEFLSLGRSPVAGVTMAAPEGTYLAWLDCSASSRDMPSMMRAWAMESSVESSWQEPSSPSQ